MCFKGTENRTLKRLRDTFEPNRVPQPEPQEKNMAGESNPEYTGRE